MSEPSAPEATSRTLPPEPSDPPTDCSPQAPRGYELLDEIGRGGMGVVYRARDMRLNREVAVKLLREDYPVDSAACARFIGESQITGQLQHPGIPAVHELRMLPNGRPFLAMKLVQGWTLHELLKARPDLSQERGRWIAVFEQVCQAVGYAHSHRLIHRDLKPANVMVGAFGEVHVMDWGLAKLLPQDGVPSTARASVELPEALPAVMATDTPCQVESATRTGAVMGTPAYMAPEQASGEVDKLDARSDVFGLGAILCQVLTGVPPYQSQDGKEARQLAARGVLQDAFARLDGCGAELELTALCKKCLSFEQNDRPPDGGAVAREVARIRQAAEERAHKAEMEQAEALVREAEQRKRRRQFLMAAAVVAVVLLAGLSGTSIGLIRAEHAAEEERLAKLDAEHAAAAEKTANEQAQKRLRQIEKGNDILSAIFADLDVRKIKQGSEPLEAVLAGRLVKAAEQLDSEAVGDPLAVAKLQDRLGISLQSLGRPQAAVRLHEKARASRAALLPSGHPDVLDSSNNLATAYLDAGQFDKALPLLEESLRLRRVLSGAEHPQTLLGMNNLASAYLAAGQWDKAIALLEETVRLRRAQLGTGHADTLTSMHNLADAYQRAGRVKQALTLGEETLRLQRTHLGADHPETLATMNDLATAYKAAGQLDKALSLDEETLRRRRARLGADHPETLGSMNSVAADYQAAGRLDKALPIYEEVVRLSRAKVGEEHPNTLTCMGNLASAYQAAGRFDQAVQLHEKALALRRAKLGADHPGTLSSMNNLGYTYLLARQPAKAVPLLEETLHVQRVKFGADHPHTIGTMKNLAHSYSLLRQGQKAAPLFAEYLSWERRRSKPNDPAFAQRLGVAVRYLLDCGRYVEAEGFCREHLTILDKTQPENWTTFGTQSQLGGILLAQQKYADAGPLLVKGYEGMKARSGQIPPPLRRRLEEAVDRLIQLAAAQKDSEALKKWQAEKAGLPKK